MIKSLFAKHGNTLYQVELNYKVSGQFVLRPTSGKPYQFLLMSAEQVKACKLFPIFAPRPCITREELMIKNIAQELGCTAVIATDHPTELAV